MSSRSPRGRIPFRRPPSGGRYAGFATLQELQQSDFFIAEPLFGQLSQLHGSVAAVLSAADDGQVWVDDPGEPTCALLAGPEGYYLGGRPRPGRDYQALRSTIPDWAYLYPAAEWLAAPDLALPHQYMQRHPRLFLSLVPKAGAEMPLPEGFSLSPEHDGAFSCAILSEGAVVAHCRPDLRVGGYVELGVWTRPDMRRRGLAGVALRSSLNLAAACGVQRVGWHCHASNRGSIAVAQRVGFVQTAFYTAFSASLPAENTGDLTPEACRALAAAFEAGRHDRDWLDFHAACAWSEAREDERAICVLERLVASGWEGRPDWIGGHWALARLRSDPRFVLALERQARK